MYSDRIQTQENVEWESEWAKTLQSEMQVAIHSGHCQNSFLVLQHGLALGYAFSPQNCHPDMMIVQNFHSVELLCQAMLTHLDLSFPDLDEEASPNYLRVAAAMDLLDMVLPVIGSLQVSICSEYVHEGTLDWAQKTLVKSMF